MKKLFLMMVSAGILLSGSAGFAQKTGEIEWLNEIDKKQVVSYGEAVNLFVYQMEKTPTTFEQDNSSLASEGIALDGYSQESILTKGMLAKMSARYLNLGGSLMYIIFGTERYAFKACVAYGIFAEDGSSSDKVSGPAMIEVFSKISEVKGAQK